MSTLNLPFSVTCKCGRHYDEVPSSESRIELNGDPTDGLYFNCQSCHDTITVPKEKLIQMITGSQEVA